MSTNYNYQRLSVYNCTRPNVPKWGGVRVKVWNRKTYFRLLLTCLVFTAVIYILFSYFDKDKAYPPIEYLDEKNLTCHIPKLNPYHSSILEYIEIPKPETCEDEFPILFRSTFGSKIFPDKNSENFQKYGIYGPCACCYQNVVRKKIEYYVDNSYELSSACLPISLKKSTVIPQEYDFIAIKCNRRMTFPNGTLDIGQVVDMHAFIHIKPEVEERVYKARNRLKKNGSLPEDGVNVVILGIDAVSHMNFKRVMPESYEYLTNNLSAVEMYGVNKIGDNTFPNLGAAMAGVETTVNTTLTCEVNESFDECPMIWKKYAQNGYRTAYGEDATWMSGFNYLKKGFTSVPTDYYFRPFGVAADAMIGTHQKKSANECYGPRMQFEVVLNYLQKMAFTMGHDRRYFQLMWSSSLTHDYLNEGRFGDQLLVSTLVWFKTKGYLDNTMFILMSDHGQRFGDILEYPTGKLEDRMPFLFFVAPSWFQRKYTRAFANLQENCNRLTTPFDLHETLGDLVNLDSLSEESILKREENLTIAERDKQVPLGISQFLPLPKSRTCDMAGIPKHFCICGRSEAKLPLDNLEVQQAASFAVRHINTLVSKQRLCASLTLVKVKSAAVVKLDEGGGNKATYQISFETKPGGGRFDASLETNSNVGKPWEVLGIERTNLYGNQSHCVGQKGLKMYCYCVDLILQK